MRWALLLLLLGCSQVGAQDKPTRELPTFEVASVKPVDPNMPHRIGVDVYPGGRVMLSCLSLKVLAMVAFRLSYWQITGGDPWVAKDLHTIEAKPSDSGGANIHTLRYTLYGIEDEHLREMLHALLIERFQSRFHRETKAGSVFQLERSARPLALRLADLSAQDAAKLQAGGVGYAGGTW